MLSSNPMAASASSDLSQLRAMIDFSLATISCMSISMHMMERLVQWLSTSNKPMFPTDRNRNLLGKGFQKASPLRRPYLLSSFVVEDNFFAFNKTYLPVRGFSGASPQQAGEEIFADNMWH
jgi:hypothetical protein